jgi:hypothetical protein
MFCSAAEYVAKDNSILPQGNLKKGKKAQNSRIFSGIRAPIG